MGHVLHPEIAGPLSGAVCVEHGLAWDAPETGAWSKGGEPVPQKSGSIVSQSCLAPGVDLLRAPSVPFVCARTATRVQSDWKPLHLTVANTILNQAGHDALDDGDRDREANAGIGAGGAGDGSVDADHLSLQVGQRPAGVAGVDGRVGLDDLGQRIGAAATGSVKVNCVP